MLIAYGSAHAILVDADAGRFGVASELTELAEKLQSPVAVINKGVIDETFPPCLGIYNGKASAPFVRVGALKGYSEH
jgi:indolepyruvate decarboxylase